MDLLHHGGEEEVERVGTYTFYAVVTSSAAGTLGTAFLTQAGIWPDQPSWGPFVLTAVALIGAWLLSVLPARRGTSTCSPSKA